jgi:hypothetical protein
MAALDFPSSPTVGQIFPSPAVVGVPVYRWDGEKWTTQGAAFDIIPSGTVMVFYQAGAPTGWTQVVAHNDKALRVVSGVGGASGGANPFSTVMAQTVVGDTTLSGNQMPSHSHNEGADTGTGATAGRIAYGSTNATQAFTNNTTGTAGGGLSHNHTIAMNIQYIDTILASRNS